MSRIASPHYSYDYNLYAHHGRQLAQHLHGVHLHDGSIPPRIPANILGSLNRSEIPVAKVFLHDSNNTIKPVGIIGAGVGGLYTALMLDSLDIEYEILEASSRTGGRLFTYKFPKGDRYDYYVSLSGCVLTTAFQFITFIFHFSRLQWF